jgi:hypothetical protein
VRKDEILALDLEDDDDLGGVFVDEVARSYWRFIDGRHPNVKLAEGWYRGVIFVSHDVRWFSIARRYRKRPYPLKPVHFYIDADMTL